MIRRFGVKNFASFKDGININFEFDGNVPESVSDGFGVSPILGIKGANGSGKTNIIKAIEFLGEFCRKSANLEASDKIEFDSFYDNESATEFYVDFEVDGNCFFYELSLTKKAVLKEILYRKNQRRTKILERVKDDITYTIKTLEEIKTIQLKSNASIVSMIKQYKFKSAMADLFLANIFFERIATNVGYLGYRDFDFNYNKIAERYYENKKSFGFIKKIITLADSGIKDIEISELVDENGEKVYFPVFIHTHAEKEKVLFFSDESNGTKALFKNMYLYWLVLQNGWLLGLDEFDIHLHAMILPKIINLFLDKNINTKNAQFIFTSHNTEIIDKLGKYRTILVNKDDNESYCYRLDEIPGSMVRNDRTIVPLYLQGKLGGVPNDERV